jgi:dihydrofolate reductase
MKLTATTFVTLDGVMQAPGGPDEDRSGGFEHGGWSFIFADEDFGRLVAQRFELADAFLLGRRTYDIFAAYWPKVTDEDHPIASRLNALPKYVASRSARELDWPGARLLEGDVVAAVRELKDRPGRELQVHGSGDLLQTLMAADLVDEHRVYVYPVVVGSGRRLFEEGGPPRMLRHIETTTTAAGVIVSAYERGGPLVVGSF